jgi:adenylate kinase family enzyme
MNAASVGSDAPLRVMIAGAPAAGKGTQCARIVEKFNLVHISVGDLLRAEVSAGTPAGLRAKAFMDAGDLVPNDVVVEMVKVCFSDGCIVFFACVDRASLGFEGCRFSLCCFSA